MQIRGTRFTVRGDLGDALSRINVTDDAIWEWHLREGEASELFAAEITYRTRHILESGLWIIYWDEDTGEPPPAPSDETGFHVVPGDKLAQGEIMAAYEETGFWLWMVHEDHMSAALAAQMTDLIKDLVASGRLRIAQQR